MNCVYAGKILHRPLTGLATTMDKINKNPAAGAAHGAGVSPHDPRLKKRTQRFSRLRAEKFGFSKEVMEEAYKFLVDALAKDGIVEDSVLQSAIDEAKAWPMSPSRLLHADVIDYSFLREAIRR